MQNGPANWPGRSRVGAPCVRRGNDARYDARYDACYDACLRVAS